MGTEIERKFLVRNDSWRHGARGVTCRQGYLTLDRHRLVRVRVMGDEAYLTIKAETGPIARREYEYPIPRDDAEEMLVHLCERPFIEKRRYTLLYRGVEWIIDEFSGDNEGLIVAEVELEREDQEVVLPEWAGEEVSLDPRYLNFNLIKYPYGQWPKETEER